MKCTACLFLGISTGDPVSKRYYGLHLCEHHHNKLKECAPIFERTVAPVETLREYERKNAERSRKKAHGKS